MAGVSSTRRMIPLEGGAIGSAGTCDMASTTAVSSATKVSEDGVTALTRARSWADETPISEASIPSVCHLPYQTTVPDARSMPAVVLHLPVSSVIQMTD